MRRPRIGVLAAAQRGLHGAEHMHQGVEADHVGGAEGRALGAADARAGEQVHLVEGQPEAGSVVQHGEDREHADAVGDEVGRVPGAHDALAQAGAQPGFEAVEQRGIGGGGRDQLDQRHVARRVEEVDAAELAAAIVGHAGGERLDRQARGVGGEDRARLQVRRDLGVEVELPLHPLGDRLDHEVAFAQAARSLP
jgi:hypothetical protein